MDAEPNTHADVPVSTAATESNTHPEVTATTMDAEPNTHAEVTAPTVDAQPNPECAHVINEIPIAPTTGDFFTARKITQVISKPRKKFVPPFIAGNLLKAKNVEILEKSTGKHSTKQPVKRTPPAPKKKKTATAPKPTPVHLSPQPGPSTTHVVDEDSLSISEDESDNCCVCRRVEPPALRDCVNLIIVKWAQCDRCGHWTHLRFCSEKNVVRRHAEFLCPHCQ